MTDLIERVARAICRERAMPACDCRSNERPCRALAEDLLHKSNPMAYQARAAIRVVLEEAIKKAEGSYPFDIETWMNSTKREMTAHHGNAIADALRAMIPKDGE